MPDTPPRRDDADKTIDEENEVDEASYESFPASDPPSSTGTYTGKTDVEDDASDDEVGEEE